MPGDAIYLVANKVSEEHCANLVFSIRAAGCRLPIRLIPFGGAPITRDQILNEVEVTPESFYPKAAHTFIARLQRTLTACPRGFLLRYLALFGPDQRFLYSDNDVVALMDWTNIFNEFSHPSAPMLVHADEEYTTDGCFNYLQPAAVCHAFGPSAMEQAITAGHFLAREPQRLACALERACDWIDAHPGIALPHDQTALHLAVLLDQLSTRNLCRDASWASSWAGDWANPLALIQRINGQHPISHLHYSGGWPDGSRAIDGLLLSNLSRNNWNLRTARDGFRHISGLNALCHLIGRARRKLRRLTQEQG